MKRIILLSILLINISLSANAQIDSLVIKTDSLSVQVQECIPVDSVALRLKTVVSLMEYGAQTDKPRYQLFPTTNMWTFLKLDTCTGRIWQVQYSTKGNDYRFETSLNSISMSYYDNYNGRYTLVATQNMYNFLLLDQLNGKVYQVQWGMDKEDRQVISIY